MSKIRAQYLQMMARGPVGGLQWLMFGVSFLLSFPYRFASWTRTCLYQAGVLRTYRASVPVVSVGNLTVGGTGKTPVVDLLVNFLVDNDIKVAVVSRGYGGSYKENVRHLVTGDDGNMPSAVTVGDEPYLLALKNPDVSVYGARKRRFGVYAAEADGAQCVILDDAFQHLGVARDLDFVLLDATRPFGNGHLLPAGPLREPPGALKRAGLLLLTRAEPDQSLPFNTETPVAFCAHRLADKVTTIDGDTVSMSTLRNRRGVAFAGIASPEYFFDSLLKAGLDLCATLAFADHSAYGQGQINRLEAVLADADYLITTEKDAVKLTRARFSKTCYVTQLDVEVYNDDVFEKQVSNLVEMIKSKQSL